MGEITDTIYKKPNMTKKWLLSNGFCHNSLLSDGETQVYTCRFPVYQYKDFAILECELRAIAGENVIRVEVFDCGTNSRYAPFYYYEYGNYDKILKIIWKNINQMLRKLGVEKGSGENATKEL